MKSFKMMIVAAALATVAAPVAAQLGPDSDQFIEAVQKRDGDKAIQLISDHPTIINSRDGKGDTALIIAIRAADEEWTGFLLNKGADPNLPAETGDTPLIAASRIGFEQAVEWLLQVGAKVDDTDKMGETPLIVAVQQRNAAIVRLLLSHGADPAKTDSAAGYSAIDYAKRDPRARQILQMLQSSGNKSASIQ